MVPRVTSWVNVEKSVKRMQMEKSCISQCISIFWFELKFTFFFFLMGIFQYPK